MKILFKFASRSRPKKFWDCIHNIQDLCFNNNYEILASLDCDDETMFNDIQLERLKHFPKLTAIFGTSKNKIDAVNRDVNEYGGDWDILVNTSDDMVFTRFVFDEIIRNDFKNHFPDLDGVLHYNDGNQKANMITMAIMGRKYYDRFKYIYHPSYKSLFADNEQMAVAKFLNKIVYLGDEVQIFEHRHPAFGKAKYDAQYIKTESREMWDIDEANFKTREQNLFDIK